MCLLRKEQVPWQPPGTSEPSRFSPNGGVVLTTLQTGTNRCPTTQEIARSAEVADLEAGSCAAQERMQLCTMSGTTGGRPADHSSGGKHGQVRVDWRNSRDTFPNHKSRTQGWGSPSPLSGSMKRKMSASGQARQQQASEPYSSTHSPLWEDAFVPEAAGGAAGIPQRLTAQQTRGFLCLEQRVHGVVPGDGSERLEGRFALSSGGFCTEQQLSPAHCRGAAPAGLPLKGWADRSLSPWLLSPGASRCSHRLRKCAVAPEALPFEP